MRVGQPGHGGRLEQAAQRQLTSKASRMREMTWVASREWPPSSKKSSWTPTRVDAEHLGPDRRQHLLDRRARRDEARPPLGRGAGRAPAAPCGRPCRWASAAARPARTKAEGTMYVGQPLAQEAAQLRRARASRPVRPTT